MTARSETNTTRVESPVGALYLHTNHVDGRVQGLSISRHGRHDPDATIDKLLLTIRDAFNRDIEDIARRHE